MAPAALLLLVAAVELVVPDAESEDVVAGEVAVPVPVDAGEVAGGVDVERPVVEESGMDVAPDTVIDDQLLHVLGASWELCSGNAPEAHSACWSWTAAWRSAAVQFAWRQLVAAVWNVVDVHTHVKSELFGVKIAAFVCTFVRSVGRLSVYTSFPESHAEFKEKKQKHSSQLTVIREAVK